MRTSPSSPQTLDALLQNRFHGAVNIRGIRFQLLYSLSRALELFNSACPFESVSLEAVEDVDLNAPQLRSLQLAAGATSGSASHFVQIKTADSPWSPSQMKKDVIPNFLELLRAQPKARCVLVFNFVPRGDIATWARYDELRGQPKGTAKEKFRTLVRSCQDSQNRSRGFTNAQADALLERLQILSLPEKQLLEQLRRALAATFDLHGDVVETYLSLFTDRFMEWATQRATVRRDDLQAVHERLVLSHSRQQTFDAYGRGLIGPLEWRDDARHEDFLEGKLTRPGHVAANLDIPRPHWQARIGEVLRTGGVAIVRASSGQGKSTLAYRFAHDQWPAEHTFLLRSALTPEDAAQVADFLRFRRETLGFPTFLLIDNAGRQTSQWPLVAREAAALGVQVLVTLRQEDWYRFMREGMFGYDVVEPSLDLEEAKQIYSALQSRGQIRTELAPAQAFERIGEPRLLMEYVFLLTTGQMLFERLRDQIQSFRVESEDPLKREILRRVALADVLGAPVSQRELLRDLAPRLRDDPQDVLESLCGEYLRVDEGNLHGLHWVRSDHLVTLLHGDIIPPSQTAIGLVPLVTRADLAAFVANALCHPQIERDTFMDGLQNTARGADLPTLIALLEGAFEAGERSFLQANRAIFDRAYELAGSNGPTMLLSAFMPTVKLDTLETITNMKAQSQAADLLDLSKQAIAAPRGRDFCRQLLSDAQSGLTSAHFLAYPSDVGRLLTWAAFCDVTLDAWPSIRAALANTNATLDLPLPRLQEFTVGLWRHDPEAYQEWFERSRDDLLAWLRWQTHSLEVVVEDVNEDEGESGQRLTVRFLVEDDADKPHEQTIERLEVLRCILPFCSHLRSQGVWPLGLTPSPDPTYKNGEVTYFHLPCDVEKNVVWRRIVEAAYAIDTYYDFQKRWFELRQLAHQFADLLADAVLKVVEQGFGLPFGPHLDPDGLLERLKRALDVIPDPPAQTPESVLKVLKDYKVGAKGWESALSALLITLQNIPDEMATGDKSPGHLAWHNSQRVSAHLAGMHSAFDQLFSISADSFSARSLNDREEETYERLADAVDAWLKNPLPSSRQRSHVALTLRRIREARATREQAIIDSLKTALRPLEGKGFRFVYPSGRAIEFPLISIPLGFEVSDPCFSDSERNLVLETLVKWSNRTPGATDYFTLLPLHEGHLFLEDGVKPPARFPEDGDDEAWERYAMILMGQHKLTPDEARLLPPLPRRVPPRVQILQGLAQVGWLLQHLTQTREVLDVILFSHHRFDQNYAEELTPLLLQLTGKLKEAVLGVAQIIESDLVPPGEDKRSPQEQEYADAYETTEQLLKAAASLCSLQTWPDVPLQHQHPSLFSGQKIIDVAERLLQ